MVNIQIFIFLVSTIVVSVLSDDVIVQPGFEHKDDAVVGKSNPLRHHFNLKSRIMHLPTLHRPSLLPHCSHVRIPTVSSLATKFKNRRLLGSANPNADDKSGDSEEEADVEEAETVEASTPASSSKRMRERKRKVKKNTDSLDLDPSAIYSPLFHVDIIDHASGASIAKADIHTDESRFPRHDQQPVNVQTAVEFYKNFQNVLQNASDPTYINSQQAVDDVNSLAGLLGNQVQNDASASRNAANAQLHRALNQLQGQPNNYYPRAYQPPQQLPQRNQQPQQLPPNSQNQPGIPAPAANQGNADLATNILNNIGRNIPAAAPYLQAAAAQTSNWMSAARGATPLNNAISNSASIARQPVQPGNTVQQSYRNFANDYVNYLMKQNPQQNARQNAAQYAQPAAYNNPAFNYLNNLAGYFNPQASQLRNTASQTANWVPNTPSGNTGQILLTPSTNPTQLSGNIASDTLNYIAQNVPAAAPYLRNAATQTSNWVSAAQGNKLTSDAVLGSVAFGRNPTNYIP